MSYDDDPPTLLVYPRAPHEYDYGGELVPDNCESEDKAGNWCDDPCPPETWARAFRDTGDDVLLDPDPVDPDDVPF